MAEVSIIVSLIIVAGISRYIMDTIRFRFYSSIYKKLGNWWNPDESWKNKWLMDKQGRIIKERFPLSSTVLVFTTDAWHFFQFVQMCAYQIIAAMYIFNLLNFQYSEHYLHLALIFFAVKTISSGTFELLFKSK